MKASPFHPDIRIARAAIVSEQEAEAMRQETEEREALEKGCKRSHKLEDLDPEDGCPDCGFYSK